MKRRGSIHIGTSGWHYKHWKGTFYPDGITADEQFLYYQLFFDTVEINNSFYKLPSPATFRDWYRGAPDDFLFAVKGSRFITHMKKLKTEWESIEQFFVHAGNLEDKLGPILFQLPPRWKVNVERLAAFLPQLPAAYRYTFEFRHASWYQEAVYRVLRQYGCAFCIYHLEGHLSPLVVTADWVYVRLHGPGAKYQGSYSAKVLQQWANRCMTWQREGKDVYVYFDNDQAGYAAFNALQLKALAGG